jgi:hypothetical protein
MPHEDPHLFPARREPASFWERTGVSRRTERRLDLVLTALIGLFVGGWTWSIAVVLEEGVPADFSHRLTASALSPDAPPAAAFLLDAAVRSLAASVDWRGESGALRVRILEPDQVIDLPDSLPDDVRAELAGAEDDTTLRDTSGSPRPGIWDVVLRAQDAVRRVPGFTYIVPVPISAPAASATTCSAAGRSRAAPHGPVTRRRPA